MDSDVIVFWVVCFSCLAGLARSLPQVRLTGPGWVVLYLLILLLCLTGRFWAQTAMIYAAGAMLLVLVLLPGFLSKLYFRRFLQQRYSAARRLARVISWLHPADSWRQQPEIVHAVELAQMGELTTASQILKRHAESHSLVSLTTMPLPFRITNQ